MIKRIFGILGIILGVIGLLLAVAQLIGVWVANPTVTRGLQDTVRTMNQGLDVADQVLTTADMIAGDLRTELQVNEGDLQPVVDKYQANLGQIRTTVDTTNSALGVAQELVGLVNSLPLVADSGNQLPQTETLAEVSQKLEDLSQTLVDLEQESPKLVEAGQQALARIDTRLGEIEADIEQLITTVKRVQADLTRTEEQIPFFVNLSSIILSFLAIWFGLAQYCLLLVSWRWVVGAKEPVSDEAQVS